MPEPEVENTSPQLTGEEGDLQLFNKGDEEETLVLDKPVEEVEEVEETKLPEEEVEETKEETEEEEEEQELPEEVLGRPRPAYKELVAAYPDIFKKFPELKQVIFREKELSEIVGDVKDAKEVVERAKDFEFFENKIVQGDAKVLLETIKDNGKADLDNFAHNFLPALKEISNDTYLQITAPILQGMLMSAYQTGDGAGNENLKNAALHVSKFIFGDHRIATGESRLPERVKKSDQPDPEREELNKERQEFLQEKYQAFDNDVRTTGFKILKSAILDGLDPNDEITEFTKRHIVEDTIAEIEKTLVADQDHIKRMDRIWEEARDNRFDPRYKNRIINAYIVRAKALMPEVRRRVKSLALRGKEPPAERKVRREITGNKSSSNGARRPASAKDVDWRKTSDEDLFSGKVQYKS